MQRGLPEDAIVSSACATIMTGPCIQCGEPNVQEGELCRWCQPLLLFNDGTDAPTDLALSPVGEAAQPPLNARLVGRLDILQQLKRLFLGARETGTVALVTLVGDPGVGRSRLAREFSRSVRAAVPDTRVLVGNAQGAGRQAYGPFVALLAERFGITEADSPREARDKIAHGVEEVLPERLWTEVNHLLGHLMGFPFPGSSVIESLAQLPDQLEVRTHIAVRRFLQKDAARGCLLLHLDGMEEADRESVELVHYLAEGLQQSPVFFLATARPTLFHRYPEWGQGEFSHTLLEVRPLAPNEAQALFGELVHEAAVPEAVIEVARDRLGGLPRAIEEFSRYLVEVGVIYSDGDHCGFSAAQLAKTGLPRTLEEILRARLQLLLPEEQSCLEAAAVIGETFWLDAVVALLRVSGLDSGDPDGPSVEQFAITADTARQEIASVLAGLCRRGLIARVPDSSVAGSPEYQFAYPPLWELSYDALPSEVKRHYHRIAAQWIGLLPQGRQEQLQAEAARHLERAGDGVRAAACFRRAADEARARYLNDRAINLYTRALACLGEADPAARLHLWHDLGSVYQLKGEFDAALDAFERMLRLSWVAASLTKAAVAFNKIGRVWRHKGKLHRALEYLQRGLTLFSEAADVRGEATSLDDIGQVLWILGRYDEALDRSARALEMRRQVGDRRSVAASLSNIGKIEKSRGLLDEAESCYREAMQLRRAVGDRYGCVISRHDLGSLAFERGNLAEARDSWEDALAEAEQIGALPLQMMLLKHLGEAALVLGQHAEARQRVNRALSLALEMEDQRTRSDALFYLASLELRDGHPAVAREYAEECLAAAEQMPHQVGRAHLVLGQILAATLFDEVAPAPAEAAEAHFRCAVQVFRELGSEVELARALSHLGEYLVEQDRLMDGRVALQEASKIFQRIGVQGDVKLQRMLAELGLVR